MINCSTSKKGSAVDLFYIVIGFFAVCVIGVLISAAVTRFNTEFQKINNPSIVPTSAQTASTTMSNTLPNTLNGGLLFAFFAACIVALILASLTPVHPVFFIFFILEVSVLIFISAGIADGFQAFIETPALATEHAQYATLIFIFRYLPFIIGIIGMVLAAVMYKVNSNAQGY